MQKKDILMFMLLAGITLHSGAQNNVAYDYDMAGNRIARRVITIPQQAKRYQSTDSIIVKETIGERTIKVFPNPTKGTIAVDISGRDDKDELRILLFNADGKQLQNKKVLQGTTPVNLSQYPAAYYILRIMAGAKIKEFKIIKD